MRDQLWFVDNDTLVHVIVDRSVRYSKSQLGRRPRKESPLADELVAVIKQYAARASEQETAKADLRPGAGTSAMPPSGGRRVDIPGCRRGAIGDIGHLPG